MTDAAESSSTTAAANHERPDAHTQRYDRQLRLWASSGQKSLESAHVLCIGGAYLSACVLKNLVLPGIGAYTILDGQKVTDFDLGNNFFVEPDSKGKSRAEEEVQALCELNPSVKGHAVQEDPREFLKRAKEVLASGTYTLIVATNQAHDVLLPLSDLAWEANVPLLAIRGAGLVGEVRVQVKELGIIETHPENTIDLRLTSPWPDLASFARTYNVEPQDSMEFSHIPFVVILLRKLEEWKLSHGGSLPVPSKDRKAFSDLINDFRKKDNPDAENVDEAVNALGQHIWRPIANASEDHVPSDVKALFRDEVCEHVSAKSTNFWILVRALRSFVAASSTDYPPGGDGHLPLPGSLPDMKALSATYIQLQKLYKAKTVQDVTALKLHLSNALEEAKLPQDSISDEEIESFAKHAAYLHLVRGRSIRESLEKPAQEAIATGFMDPINPVTIPQYIALQTADEFYAKRGGRFPGSTVAFTRSLLGASAKEAQDANEEEGEQICANDEADMISLSTEVCDRLGVKDDEEQEMVFDACKEFTRSGHGDLPSTAAFLGGIAAQEIIKITTRQYIPLDNTAVYDGIKQTLGIFKF